MNDRPDAGELLEAVRRFLADEAVPALSGYARYQARVAANVVAIVAREIELEAEHLAAEWRGLAELHGADAEPPSDPGVLRSEIEAWNAALVEAIRAGQADEGPWRRAVFDHLERVVDRKLTVARGSRR